MLKKIVGIVLVLGLIGCNVGYIKEDPSILEARGEFAIFPDNLLVIGANESEGELSKFSTKAKISENTLTFELSAIGSSRMMMSVKNNFKVIVKYDLEMVDYRGNLHYTSSCPVKPGMGVYESWPHDIPELRVKNIRVIKDKNKLNCQ